jgi:UDP-N-acetylglucosamine--N-acetylmuramyl-(pentapeptide) pyrophosphoryl-undecaprenol N-acetylglucosamine transferase
MADETRRDAPAPHVLLSGGGSGGHVFPALAVGDELGRRGWRVSFAGNPAGMEHGLVAARGVEFVPLAARPMVGRSAPAQLRSAATLARSARRARGWVKRERVSVVVGTGGYASVPAVVGGRWARRPVLLVEPNARAGAANRWLSRLAQAAAIAYGATARELRCPSFVAGVPVRESFFAVPPLAAGAPPRLLVLGGSQGSQRLNRLLPEAVAQLLPGLAELTVLHQCGERNLAETAAAWEAVGIDPARYSVVPFVADVAAEMARASLVLSRAGAITLAEICAAGRGALLVPLGLAGGHQGANARAVAAAGAARLLDESGATPETLAERLSELLADPTTLVAMGDAARRLARPGAAAAIADRVVDLAARGGRRR